MATLMELSEAQQKYVTYYSENNMKHLKRICDPIIRMKGVDQQDYDDLYSDALKVLLESVQSYDDKKDCSFRTYLIGNIKNSFYDWTRDQLRWKRSNLETENGKIKIDEDSKLPIKIMDKSFDEPVEEGLELSEKIASDFTIESNLADLSDETREKVKEFLDSLPRIQRSILLMKMDDVSTAEIKEQLGLSDYEFTQEMKSIKRNENIAMFSKNKNDGNYKMEEENMEDRVIAITESESYRTDKYSLFSLLQQKADKDINCKYILQRKPFQWTEEEANRYFCRLLSSLPVPEIVLCEQVKKGLTISYLIDGLQRLSYAEAFKNNRMKIGKSGSERHLIEYREYVLDDSGERVMDDEGLPLYELKVCDVIGKTYKDLPDELKKRFNNFNFNVTKFFNCTDQQIADHIRDYNNHSAMNKEQVGLTKISITTAEKIKKITDKNPFFKNSCRVSDTCKTKGKLERTVAEALMFLFHRDEWKSNLEDAYKYVDENVPLEEFDALNSDLIRLELAIGDDKKLKPLFTSTSIPLWVSVFSEFTKFDLEDKRFVDFLNAYADGLKNSVVDGVKLEDFKSAQNKQKSTMMGKFNFHVKLMKNYLHIEENEAVNSTESKNEENTAELPISNVEKNSDSENKSGTGDSEILKFVQENVRENIKQEDIDIYRAFLRDYIDNGSRVYAAGEDTVIALMAYATDVEKDNEFSEWLDKENEKKNTIYGSDHKVNFTFMKRDFDRYCGVLEGLEENNNSEGNTENGKENKVA